MPFRLSFRKLTSTARVVVGVLRLRIGACKERCAGDGGLYEVLPVLGADVMACASCRPSVINELVVRSADFGLEGHRHFLARERKNDKPRGTKPSGAGAVNLERLGPNCATSEGRFGGFWYYSGVSSWICVSINNLSPSVWEKCCQSMWCSSYNGASTFNGVSYQECPEGRPHVQWAKS